MLWISSLQNGKPDLIKECLGACSDATEAMIAGHAVTEIGQPNIQFLSVNKRNHRLQHDVTNPELTEDSLHI